MAARWQKSRAMSNSGAVTLGDVAGKLPMLDGACSECELREHLTLTEVPCCDRSSIWASGKDNPVWARRGAPVRLSLWQRTNTEMLSIRRNPALLLCFFPDWIQGTRESHSVNQR